MPHVQCLRGIQGRTLPRFKPFPVHISMFGYNYSAMYHVTPQGSRNIPCHAEKISTENKGIDERVKAVAHKLLQKEEELKFITSPGRIPPKASVVAALRNEIAQLRNQLSSNQPIPTMAVPVSTSENKKRRESQALKTSGRKVQAPSSARTALLMVEKKLSDATRGASAVERAPVSDKVKHALEMIEHNMSSMTDASKNLNEFETLQVENAVLRTNLEVTLEKKRRLEKLHQAYKKGQISPQNTKKPIEMNNTSKERATEKDLQVVYSF